MTQSTSPARIPAVALFAGAFMWLSIGIIHPRVGHGEITSEIVRLATPLAVVHGIAIVCAVALLFGLAAFSLRRGLERAPNLAALIIFAIATLAIIAAATIDGFLIPSVAASRAHDPTQTASVLIVIGALAEAIQVFTKSALVGCSVAIGLWSIDLFPQKGAVRNAGVLGFGVAIGTVVLMILTPYIGAHALIGLGLLQGCWYATIATLLASERL